MLDKVTPCVYNIDVAWETGSAHGSIAQLGEHMPYKHGVTGSSPVVPTKSFSVSGNYLAR